MPTVLMETELVRLDAYWRAANYLSVGQILSPRQPAAQRAAPARAHQGRGNPNND
jgi:phosphoketolase